MRPDGQGAPLPFFFTQEPELSGPQENEFTVHHIYHCHHKLNRMPNKLVTSLHLVNNGLVDTWYQQSGSCMHMYKNRLQRTKTIRNPNRKL